MGATREQVDSIFTKALHRPLTDEEWDVCPCRICEKTCDVERMNEDLAPVIAALTLLESLGDKLTDLLPKPEKKRKPFHITIEGVMGDEPYSNSFDSDHFILSTSGKTSGTFICGSYLDSVENLFMAFVSVCDAMKIPFDVLLKEFEVLYEKHPPKPAVIDLEDMTMRREAGG